MSKKPTIKIVQYLWGSNNTAYRLTHAVNAAYCHRHGYPHCVKTFPPRDDRACLWEKIPAILDELHDCDYVFFLDADAFFYSHELTVEEELVPLLEDKEILMAADLASERIRFRQELPNTGTILLRNAPVTREILNEWNECSEDPELEHFRFHLFHEQEAFWRSVMPRYREHIRVLRDYYLMNGYCGVFVRHLMSLSDEKRVRVLQAYLKERPNLFPENGMAFPEGLSQRYLQCREYETHLTIEELYGSID